MKNILWWPFINNIGGVETFLYELARKYGADHDLTLFYRTGDPAQIRRYKQYMRVRKYKGEHITCDVAIFGWNTEIIDNVDAKEYIQTLHADYKAQNMQPCRHPKITRYVGVSQAVCDIFTDAFGLPAELCYNPLVVDKPRKMLRLVSATRLTKEKGGARIPILAKALDDAGIPYTWEIFTNDQTRLDVEKPGNIVYRPCRLDIRDFIANADYMVQLSDTEAYSYSVIESLALGTPVIVCPWPCIQDLGVEDRVNGFVLPFDMSDIPVKDIYKGLKKFKYQIRQDRWGELLSKGEGNYEDEKNKPVKVRTRIYYFDIVLQRYMVPGEEQEVTEDRADRLLELGVADYAD